MSAPGSKRRRKIAGFLLLAVLVGLGLAGYGLQAFVRRQLPSYLRAQVGQALGREVSLGRISFWPLGAVTVHDIQVLPLPHEPSPPLTADRVRVQVSLWDLLFRRRLRIPALDVYGVRVRAVVDLQQPASGKANPATQLLALQQIGLERIGIHDARLEVTTLLPGGVRQPVTAEGLDIQLGLLPESFTYRLSAAGWSGAGLLGEDLLFAGNGARDKITLTEARARFQGGTVRAEGAYISEKNDLILKVHAEGLPVGRIAPQLGVPTEWGVQGNLSGDLEVSALSGAVRRVQGDLTVAPGAVARAKAEFPWETATVHVDWQPAETRLSNLRIQGKGLKLIGSAVVTGTEEGPLTSLPFTAQGTLEATSTEAVVNLANLLAFETPGRGEWDVGDLTLTFTARGTVGELQEARANGRFEATGMEIRSTPRGMPLVIQTIRGRVERDPNSLRLRQVRATTEGLAVMGDVTITPGTELRPGAFQAAGTMDLESLRTFRQQLPEAPFWEWLQPAKPDSRAHATFQASGPLGHPEAMAASGGFRFRNFIASLPAGPGNERWNLPVREVHGWARMRNGRLAVSGLELNSTLLRGTGQGMLRDLSRLSGLSAEFRVASTRWEELPPLKGRIPSGLSGGSLAVRVQVNDSLASPVTGSAYLENARYRLPAGANPKSLTLDAALADFQLEGGRLAVPRYKLVTRRFRTSGHATLTEEPAQDGNKRWVLRTDGRFDSPQAGLLFQLAGTDLISGGRLMASYQAEAAAGASGQPLAGVTATGHVRLERARLRQSSVSLPLSPDDLRIRFLEGDLALKNGEARFSDAIWQAPRFRVAGEGSYDGREVDGEFRLESRAWYPLAGELARSLPISGGRLVAEMRISGPVDSLASLPVRGTARLSGARLAGDRNASVPLEGGQVTLRVNLTGTLGDLFGAEIDGGFMVRDVPLPALQPGVRPLRLELGHGQFHRRGTEVSLTDLAAGIPGARLTGSGKLLGIGTGNASHRFEFQASGASLASLLPMLAPVPGKVTGGRFEGSLTLSGTAVAPLASMTGNAEMTGAEWTPPGGGTSLAIHRLSARFVRRGNTATVERAEFRTAGGSASLRTTFRGLGSPSGPSHSMRLSWRFENASAWATRFLPVPGWFSGGLFTGAATIEGRSRAPAETVHGRFDIRDAGFRPPVQILGGPVKPLNIREANGVFYRSGRTTVIRKLTLDSPYARASGQVVAEDSGSAHLQARLEVANLESLVDLWPDFQDRIRGGQGGIRFNLRGPLLEPGKLVGTVNLFGKDGALTIADVEELYATHPFDQFVVRLALGGGRVRLREVKLRGSTFNLDGRGTVRGSGEVRADGKAWFTSEYTRKVVGSRLLYAIAKLIGWGRVKSDFRVFGTLHDPRLKLGITNSLVWKLFIRKKVPDRLRKVATGDASIWPTEAPNSARRGRN